MRGFGVGATVDGDFKVGEVESLFDTNYAPPFDEERAGLASAC